MFLADFNRKINVKAYTRVIGGKVIPVKGSRRTVMRLREALEDLRSKTAKTNIEHAYNINPRTGIVGNIIDGETHSVNPRDAYKKRPYNAARKRNVLHSHPSDNSLSYADLVSAFDEKSTTFAVTPSGSVYRGSAKNKMFVFGEKKYNNHLQKAADYFYKNGYKADDSLMLGTHSHNLFLKDHGIINYRYKLSDVDKKLVESAKPTIDAIRQNKLKEVKFTMTRREKDTLFPPF